MKKKSLSSIVFLIAGILILPFIILSFFARPASDDLFIHYLVDKYQFEFSFRYIYHSSSSRFFSLPLLLAFCSSNWLLSNYYVFPLFYLFVFWIASWLLVRKINIHFLSNLLDRNWEIILGLLNLLLFILVIPDTASGFYWISASATHTTPAIALILCISMVIELNFGVSQWRYTFFAAICLAVICGCSELLSLAVNWVLLLSVIYFFRTRHPYRIYFLVLLAMGMIFSGFLFLGEGNLERASHFQSSGFMYAFLGSVFAYLNLWAGIISNPFVYVLVLTMVFLFPEGRPVRIMGKKSWIFFFGSLPFCIYFLPLYFNASGVPARANNPIALFLIFCLFACCYQYRSEKVTPYTMRPLLIFCIMLVSNVKFFRAWENLVSGYLFSSIYDTRVAIINQARLEGRHSVTLTGYQEAWNDMIQVKIPGIVQQPVRKLVSPTPSIIQFSDDLRNKYWGESYAEYYSMDTIFHDKYRHVRFTLSERGKAFTGKMMQIKNKP